MSARCGTLNQHWMLYNRSASSRKVSLNAGPTNLSGTGDYGSVSDSKA